MAYNKSTQYADVDTRGARMHIPRSRGAVSGLLLMLLGAWGALAPLVGPYVHFGFTPDTAWHISGGRFWLETLPGAVALLGGFLLLTAANRVMTSFGAWLGVAAGAWFVINTSLATLFNLGSVGVPIATSKAGKAIQFLLLFDGLGALIIFTAASALGRLGVISVRDVEAARRREQENRDDEPAHRSVRETPIVETPAVQTSKVDATEVPVPTRNAQPTTRTVANTARNDRPSARGGATRLDTEQ